MPEEQDEVAAVPLNDRRPAGRFPAMGVPTEKSKDFRNSLKRLWGLLTPERPILVLILVLALVATTLNSLGPRVLGRGTDVIIEGVTSGSMDMGALHHRLYEALGVYGGAGVLSLTTAYLIAGVVQRLMFRLRTMAEDKIHALPLSYIDHEQRGDLLSRVTNDLDNVAQSLQQTLSQMLTSVLLLVGVAVMMFTISPRLALVALITVPMSVWSMRLHRRQGPAALHLAVEEHRRAQRTDRGDLHRARRREGVRPPARGGGAVPDHQRRALRRVVRRPVHVEPDAAGHDVPGQPPVRDRGRRRRAGWSPPAPSRSVGCRPSSSTRASSPCP